MSDSEVPFDGGAFAKWSRLAAGSPPSLPRVPISVLVGEGKLRMRSDLTQGDYNTGRQRTRQRELREWLGGASPTRQLQPLVLGGGTVPLLWHAARRG